VPAQKIHVGDGDPAFSMNERPIPLSALAGRQWAVTGQRLGGNRTAGGQRGGGAKGGSAQVITDWAWRDDHRPFSE